MRVYPNLNLETLRPDKTVNPLSSLITTLLGELAAIERQGIIDRLNSGRELYIQKGGRLGRKPGSRKTAEQRKEEYREAIALLKKGYSIRNVAKLTGKAVSTIQQVKKTSLIADYRNKYCILQQIRVMHVIKTSICACLKRVFARK